MAKNHNIIFTVENEPAIENENISTTSVTLESSTTAGLQVLVEATKKSNSLPCGKTRHLYESYPCFHNIIGTELANVLTELSEMMTRTNCVGYIEKKSEEDKLEMIIEANDGLLENVGSALDELCGVPVNAESKFTGKKMGFSKGSWNRSISDKLSSKTTSQILNDILNQTKHIEKPQTKFMHEVNNDRNVPFEPRIKQKYNMLKPLSCISWTDEDGICYFTHPYEFELEKFTPPPEQMVHRPPISYKSLAKTPLIFVNEIDHLNQMVKDLEMSKEIAVDLEHHSYRSFQGFTCLMQISTRCIDYVIDTLALRSELEILNKVLTDPSIVKVFHGADSDILWLQRDLSLYVVNMFDTHQAAKVLNFPKLSLAYLLSYYCNVDAQKHFQLADWRVRPLPLELITYAREDTHYLLFIYDNLRNELIEKANHQTNLLQLVISESTRICLKTYIKPQFERDGYLDLYRRSKKLFDNRQKFALQQLFEWRDRVAREWDESYPYVLPDHMMLNISEILPREAQGILACCNPVPAPVRQHLLVLHQIIHKAREQPLVKPILEEQKFHRHTSSLGSFDNPLQCPHDLNHEGEFRDDLAVLCNGKNGVDFSSGTRCAQPIVSVFEDYSDCRDMKKVFSTVKAKVYLSPYHLYQLSKKFSESTEVRGVRKKCDSADKEQENSRCLMKEREVKGTSDDGGEKSESPRKHVEQVLTLNESNINENRVFTGQQRMANSNKRKMDEETGRTKKQKKKIRCGLNSSLTNETEIKEDFKKKKKKIPLKGRKNQFQAFDFNSVNYEKFKSTGIGSSKKIQNTRKSRKKTGKKNLKISL